MSILIIGICFPVGVHADWIYWISHSIQLENQGMLTVINNVFTLFFI